MKRVVSMLALLLMTSAAEAATHITFDGFCDGMRISGDGLHFVTVQTGACLQGTLVMGAGYKIGSKKKGGNLVLGVNWESFDGHPAGSEQYSYIIQYPFVTGGTWEEIFTTNGTSSTVLNSGTYTVSGAPGEGRRGSTPTVYAAPRN
ncbi:MAG: hypothetical protein JO261_09710 [Alphaproteobacteria bacterium]|nr:hypothetical protein [Alphaproteobacteria bacterium]MBV9693965.1 hypothetical protein [Alphaproteobacteria bacterium]